jgi:hypothetical protein
MPAYKYDSESEAEEGLENSYGDAASETSDLGEPGPDDTFRFRQSFTKDRRQGRVPLHEDMDEPFFETEDVGEFEMDHSYQEMQEDELLEDGSVAFSEAESDDEQEEAYLSEPIVGTVRIEKRANWLDQIDYTDRAVKRLKAMTTRERQQNSKIHWGGQTPDLKYTTEDLERDLFGEAKASLFFGLSNCRRRNEVRLIIYKQTL